MARTTRAAARAQEAELVSSSPDARNGDTNNEKQAEVEVVEAEALEPDTQSEPKKSKGKKKGKSKKNKKNKAQEVETELEAPIKEVQTPLEVDGEDDVKENAEMEEGAQGSQDNNSEENIAERPASPTVKKEHIARMSPVPDTPEVERIETPTRNESQDKTSQVAVKEPKEVMDKAVDVAEEGPASHSAPQPLSESVQDIKISSQATSLLTSPTIAMSPTSDPIEAMDALEDALEEVGKILPKVEPMSPQKPSRRQGPVRTTSVKRTAPVLVPNPAKSTFKGAPKTIQSTNKQTSNLTVPTQPSALSRSTSVRATPATKLPATTAKTNTAAKRQSVLANRDSNSAATNTDYLASKRRPISMQFPPPPAAVKSSKPPTKPTFTLPGDALMAKRRAALEEKVKKEQEEMAKKREFKARPAPNTSRPRPTSMIVRQNASSLARRSIMGEPDSTAGSEKENTKASTTLKRAGTVTGATSTSTKERLAAKRASMLQTKPSASTTANTASKRQSVIVPKDPTQPSNPKRSSIVIPKRQSTLAAPASSSTRTVSNTYRTGPSTTSPTTKTTLSAEDSAALKQKAKQIYNRDRVEKEDRNRERREKEEAAKRARAEAAEKGRAASREWAEKQKRKLMEAKLAKQNAGSSDPVVSSVVVAAEGVSA